MVTETKVILVTRDASGAETCRIRREPAPRRRKPAPPTHVFAACGCRVPLGGLGYSADPAVVAAEWCQGCRHAARIGYGE